MALAIGLWNQLENQSKQRQQIEHYLATMQLSIAPLMPIKDNQLFKAQLNKLRAISLLPLESIAVYGANHTELITTGFPAELKSVQPDFTSNVSQVYQSNGFWLAQVPFVSTKTEPFLPSISDETFLLFAVFHVETALASWLMPIGIVVFGSMMLLFIIRSTLYQQQQRLQTDVGLVTHKLSQMFSGQRNVSLNEELVPELALLKPAINELASHQTKLQMQHSEIVEQLQLESLQFREQIKSLSASLADLTQCNTIFNSRVQDHVHSLSMILAQRSEMDDKAFQHALVNQVALLKMALNTPPAKANRMRLTEVVASFLPEARQWLWDKGIELNLFEGKDNIAYEIACCSEQLNTLLMALVQLAARANAATELTLSVNLYIDSNKSVMQLAITSNGDGISAQLCQRLTAEKILPLHWHEADIGIIISAVQNFAATIDVQLLDGLGSAIVLTFPIKEVAPVPVNKLSHVLLFEQSQSNLTDHASSMKLRCEHVVKVGEVNELHAKISHFPWDIAIILLPPPADILLWQQVLGQLSRQCTVKCFSNSSDIEIWREALVHEIQAAPFCLADLDKPSATICHSRPKLLVVDDNKTNQAFVQILMKGQQVELFTADCGLDAIGLCKQLRFDAILLDIQLPDISGIDVAKQLRQIPSYQNIPILAFTAHALGEEVTEFLKAGMNDVIFKPLEAAKLGQILHWCSVGQADDIV